jgi:hypothetical protein
MRLLRACLTLFLLAAAPAFSEDTFQGVQRIVAIGDIHGDYDRFVTLLRTAKLVDANNAWQGGATHLVIVGDFIDRGPASRKVMDLLIELGPQAQSAGGRVHALLGNHEAMNIYGDLRYVSSADFSSFRTADSKRLIDDFMNQTLSDLKANGTPPQNEAEFREKFKDSHPLGWVERRLAFLPNGKYGKWLLQLDVMIRINDFLFVHGGISPKYVAATRKEVNDRIWEELSDFSRLPQGLAMDADGPLWYRGLAQLPENDKDLAAHIDRVLETQEARHIVIGHTTVPVILPRFGGKVIMVDIGLPASTATPALLMVEGSRCYNVYRNGRVDVPLDGGDVLQYLSAAQKLDPANSRLRALIKKGGRL